MTEAYSDADLIAFLGGAVTDEALIDALEAAINADAALAERIEALALNGDEPEGTAAAVRGAFAPVLAAPVPEHLIRIVATSAAPAPAPAPSAKVVDLAAARARRTRPAPANDTDRGSWRWPQLGAMAASLVLGVMIGGPLLTGGGGNGGGSAAPGGSLVLASAELDAMLDRAPSGERVDLAALGTGQVVLTFRDTEGRLCRQFQLEGRSGISDALACAGAGGGGNAVWQVEAYGRRSAPVGELRLAGGDAAPAVVAAVDAMIGSDPVVGADELAELRKR